jgi:methionyl-tRNA formyltransferase
MEIKKVIFLGSKKLGLEILKKMHALSPNSLTCIATLNDDGKDQRSQLKGFVEFSEKKNIPLRIINNNNDLKSTIQEFSPDIFVVNGYYKIISKEILDLVPFGFIGIHGSLLPAYRGGSPLVWAILLGDSYSGISLFHFDEGIDSGDIIAQKRFEIGKNDTIAKVLDTVEKLSIDIIDENFNKILSGKSKRIKQKVSSSTYSAMRQPADGKIDWGFPAKNIHDFIRAQTKPYPGAFCFSKTGEKIIIWKSSVFENPYFGPQGRVVRIQDHELIVTCGDNHAIVIEDAEIENQPNNNPFRFIRFNETLT